MRPGTPSDLHEEVGKGEVGVVVDVTQRSKDGRQRATTVNLVYEPSRVARHISTSNSQ